MLVNRSFTSFFLLASAGIAAPQPAPQPQPSPQHRVAFEVASIKLHPSPITTAYDPVPRGARVTGTAITLLDMIEVVYGLRRDQVAGGPGWVGSDHYDMVAKAEGEAAITRSEFRDMMRNLLATRFKLQFHREAREEPVYDLVVGKDGPKLQVSELDAPSGSSVRTTENGNLMVVKKGTIDQLALQLSVTAGRPVLDKTGLAGMYTYTLNWFPENRILEPHGDIPSMFAAVQEQLGLKLESSKAAVDMLVIDRAEKPSEN